MNFNRFSGLICIMSKHITQPMSPLPKISASKSRLFVILPQGEVYGRAMPIIEASDVIFQKCKIKIQMIVKCNK